MATKKKVTLKVGDWVEFKKKDGRFGPAKGQLAIVNAIEKGEVYDSYINDGDGGYVLCQEYQLAWMNENGDADNSSLNEEELSIVTKIPAPQYVVAWSDEYTDPFRYFKTAADAKKLAGKKTIGGRKVVEIRVFKAMK